LLASRRAPIGYAFQFENPVMISLFLSGDMEN
jgi:hypothetical protein